MSSWMNGLRCFLKPHRRVAVRRQRRIARFEQLEARKVLTVAAPPMINFAAFNTVEGSGITLQMTVAGTPATDVVTVNLDLDFDGQFDDATGTVLGNDADLLEFNLTWSQLVSFGIDDGGSAALFFTEYPIAIQAIDGNIADQGTSVAETTILVENVAPIISAVLATPSGGGGGCGASGGSATLTATILEAGPAAELAELSATVDWGDGSLPEVVTLVNVGVGQYAVAPGTTHNYVTSGNFTVSLTVVETDVTIDFLPGTDTESTLANISGGGGGPQTVCLDAGVLTVNGSGGDDNVSISSSNGTLQVAANFPGSPFPFATASVNQIVVLLGAGDDSVLNATAKTMVAVGGPGGDFLADGGGRSILIGGTGTDVLSGGGGQDILVDSSTDHDANTAALLALLSEWNSGDTLANRINKITVTGVGPNFVKLNASTIDDDGVFDLLIGGGGADLILLHSNDFSLGLFDNVILLP